MWRVRAVLAASDGGGRTAISGDNCQSMYELRPVPNSHSPKSTNQVLQARLAGIQQSRAIRA